jgi:NADH-quinone oxidoreductase subunit N
MAMDWAAILPHLILAGGGTIIFLVGAFWRRRPGELLFALALLSAVAAGAAAILISPGAPSFQAVVDLGTFARYFTFLFAAITSLTLLLVRQYARARSFAGDEFYGLLLFAALGMLLVAGALNWLIFFLGLELLSISLYVLIAIRKGEPFSNEAGLKYFIMGAVASAFLTFGIALLYAASGTLQIGPSLAVALGAVDLPVMMAALSLILVGLGFKISLVPFHLWTPDVYQGAPSPVTAFLSTGSKVALFAALVRFSLLVANPIWVYCLPTLWVLAALTMVVGNLTAVYQTRVKRLLAYSSVAQMGYLFMTLLAVKQGGLGALMFYLAVYAVMEMGAFGILGTLSGEEKDLDALEDCRGLGYSQPWRAAVLAGCLISLAGLPPTAGFMGKFALFRAVLQADFPVLAVIGILTVIISISFYMKVVVYLYMQPTGRPVPVPGPDLSIRLAGAVIFLLIIWLGVAPSPLFAVIARVIASLPGLT